MKSRNLSYDSLLNVDETCTYSVDPTNTTHTMFTQHAKITVPVFGFGGKVETICSSNFHTNAKKGLQVMETICDKIKAETTEFFTGGAPKVEGTTL
jgi:UDP-N-acetyl-D-mannosaminuronic acid transferase (WecB/TagA/CpsF family)